MTDEFLAILQSYGYSVVPLTAWNTADIVRAIELMDAVLQQRADEQPPIVEEEIDWDDDYEDDWRDL